MKKKTQLGEVLDFAVHQKKETIGLYAKLVEKAKDESVKHIFESFEDVVKTHHDILLKLKQDVLVLGWEKKSCCLEILNHHVELCASRDTSYADMLLVAIKLKTASCCFYSELAGMIDDVEFKIILLEIAYEAERQRKYFEMEYDAHILMWN